MLKDLIHKNRSYRRFKQEVAIDRQTLYELVDLARVSASAANLQPLKYILSNNPHKNATIFQELGWAAYLRDWPGPEEGLRPSAYIIILGDKTIAPAFGCDHGIAAQSILLGAIEKGLGGCMIATIKSKKLRDSLAIPERYEILLVIALGKPAEKIEIETARAGDNIEYWRDNAGVHHVPKRPLDEIIID